MNCRLLLICVALTCGCSDDDLAQKGSEGGECRISLDPCDEGLICSLGECRTLESGESTARLGLDVSVIATEMDADGRDTTPIRFSVRDLDAAEPYVGEIRLWVEPAGAGVLKDGLVELDEDGKALTTYTTCDGRYRDCPALATIKFARAETPMDWFGARTITLIGGNDYGQRIGVPGQIDPPTGGTSTPPAGGGGGGGGMVPPSGGGGNPADRGAPELLSMPNCDSSADFMQFTVGNFRREFRGEEMGVSGGAQRVVAKGLDIGFTLQPMVGSYGPNDPLSVVVAFGQALDRGNCLLDGTRDNFEVKVYELQPTDAVVGITYSARVNCTGTPFGDGPFDGFLIGCFRPIF